MFVFIDRKYKEIFNYIVEKLHAEYIKNRLKDKDFSEFLRLYKSQYHIVLSEEVLYDYLIFQLQYWKTNNIKRFDGVLLMPWIFGPKAFQRWVDRSSSWQHFNEIFCKKHKIKTRWSTFVKVDIEDVIDIERGRFHNTSLGFLHCQDFANKNLYSEFCKKCKFQINCGV